MRPIGDVVSVRRRIGIALAVIALLNAADIVTTRAALDVGGHEGNPVAWWLLDNGLLEVAKLAVIAALCVLVMRVRRHHEWLNVALWLIVGWYSAAVAGNVMVWKAGA